MIRNYMSVFQDDNFEGVEAPVSAQPFYTEGFVHLVDKDDATLLCRDLSSIRIPVHMVSKHKLGMGDWIECKVAYNTGVKRHLVSEIEKIKSVAFDEAPCLAPSTKVKLNNKDIKLGSRVILRSEDKLTTMTDIRIEGAAIEKIALVMDEGDYCVNTLLRAGFNHVFFAKPEIGLRKQIANVLFALFHAKREAASGKNVLFFIESLTKLVRLYGKVMQKDEDGMLDSSQTFVGAIEDVKTLYLSARQLDGSGSLTCIGLAQDARTPTDELYMAEFLEAANFVL